MKKLKKEQLEVGKVGSPPLLAQDAIHLLQYFFRTTNNSAGCRECRLSLCQGTT